MFGACSQTELLHGLGAAQVDLRDGLTWPELKQSFDSGDDQVPTSRSEFFGAALPADVISELLAVGSELTFTPMGGAYNRVPADATAFVHRSERFLLEHLGGDLAVVRRSWAVAHPHGSGRVYPNFPDPDLTDWAEAYHGPNYARLTETKRQYDPDRVFHFPQSL
jgi:FAD/FMN-containing dehydrogenase